MSAQLGYPIADEEAAEFIETIGNHPDHILLVAEDDHHQPLGWAHVFIARRIFAAPFADLGGLVVDEAVRGAQIGTQLVQAAEAWAVEQGCQRMIVRSNVTREQAHRFYLRLGYKILKRQAVFEKLLKP
jgi:GNAT superfamily N-acetyltransferase